VKERCEMFLHDNSVHIGELYENKDCVNTNGSVLESIDDLLNSGGGFFPSEKWLIISNPFVTGYYSKKEVAMFIEELKVIHSKMKEEDRPDPEEDHEMLVA